MSKTGLKDAPCTAKIRPFPDATEFVCHLDEHGADMKHVATFTSRANQGVQQSIHWFEGDRRTFRGAWVKCNIFNCLFPKGHLGSHA